MKRPFDRLTWLRGQDLNHTTFGLWARWATRLLYPAIRHLRAHPFFDACIWYIIHGRLSRVFAKQLHVFCAKFACFWQNLHYCFPLEYFWVHIAKNLPTLAYFVDGNICSKSWQGVCFVVLWPQLNTKAWKRNSRHLLRYRERAVGASPCAGDVEPILEPHAKTRLSIAGALPW